MTLATLPETLIPRGLPEVHEVLQLLTDQKVYFQAFHAQCVGEEQFYRLKRDVPVPDGIDFEPTRPATATAIINVGTDHVDVKNFAIDVPSAARTQARAERIKKFHLGAWLSIKPPVLRTAVRHAFIYGLAWTKVMYASDRYPDAPHLEDFSGEAEYKEALADFLEKKQISFPFVDINVNPKNLVWDDSKVHRNWVIEFYEKDVMDIHRRYPEWMAKTGKKVASWVEYWTDTHAMYIADTEVVWEGEHGYGFNPHTMLIPNNALDWDDGPPEDRYWGILRPVHSLLDAEARLMTQYEAIVRTVSWRTVDFQGPQELAEKTLQSYELFAGKNYVPVQVEVKASPQVNVPPEILRQLDMVQTMIEEATFPNVIRGVRPKGVSTGFGISVLAGMGRLVFQGVADGLARMMEEVNAKRLKLIENKVRGNVTVHARSDVHSFDQTIGPDDIRGFYENRVTIKAEAPEERERESLLAARLYGMLPGFSQYEALRRSGVANPLEMMNQRKAEDLVAGMFENQLAELQARLGMTLAGQLGEAAGVNVGSQNLGGPQLQRPGERNIQQARVASQQGRPSVFPQGTGGIDILGKQLGSQGGAVGVPSGQTIRRQ